MSEDPVKYEPEQIETLQVLKDAMPEKFPGEPDTVRPEWEDQRIRIEALRAAAVVVAGTVDPRLQPQSNGKPIGVNELVISHAKQFATYLESGG